MHNVFEDIALRENGKFHFHEGRYTSYAPGINRVQTTEFADDYEVSFMYREQRMVLKNQMGASNVGTLNAALMRRALYEDFELESKGFWYKLTGSAGQMGFNLKGGDTELERFLDGNATLLQLSDLVRKYAFEPHITGKDKNGYFEVHTHYHLQFAERVQVPQPLIAFYKDLIDFLLK